MLIPLLPHINQLVARPYFRSCQTVAGFEDFLTVAAFTCNPDDAAIADGAAFLVADGAVDAEAALGNEGREAEGRCRSPGRQRPRCRHRGARPCGHPQWLPDDQRRRLTPEAFRERRAGGRVSSEVRYYCCLQQ